ncbi:hypothetical protein [Amycolatopsis granulosa]|uniref:hypothetical protein n=1 Tax=Amycolatopsis granulosa TaxID=185684 RepID=UPI0014205ED2|nr:hypothetical protein [Amycolatopsis granulosa]NIH87062.1 hypothetical protein [Amycolatopsis granulosa]
MSSGHSVERGLRIPITEGYPLVAPGVDTLFTEVARAFRRVLDHLADRRRGEVEVTLIDEDRTR